MTHARTLPTRLTRPPRRRIGYLAAVVLVLCCRAAPAQVGAGGRAVPRTSYYMAISQLYMGDYVRAERDFRSELRSGAIKTAQSRWVDSICYFTMLGECHYQAGQFQPALDQYNAALELFVAFSNWMLRVQFPVIRPSAALARRVPPWGRSTRPTQLGQFPNTMKVVQGRIDNSDVVQRGGVVQQAMLFPVNVHEIIRCTALAMRRRRELMGPVTPYDPLTDDLVTALSRRPGPPNHWSEAWIDLQLGLAYAGAGNTEQAQRFLARSLIVAGNYDHPLTSTALVELGRQAMAAGDLEAAARLLEEASYSAYVFENIGVIEEAFRLGVRVHLMAGKKGLYPLLQNATIWAKVKRQRQLYAWLMLLTAENSAAIGQAREADSLLGAVRGLVGRRAMAGGLLGGQLSFQTARVGFQLNRPETAFPALERALAFARTGSKWLFQISLADNGYMNGSLSARVATLLYGDLLRDPRPADWTRDPFESISVLTTPHRAVYEHWFHATLKRKEVDTALEVADRARRHTFLSSLPMGGRLLALRSTLETPASQLDQNVALHRQDLLVRYPGYDRLAQQARAIQGRLTAAPLVPADKEAKARQRSDVVELARISLAQEAILREMALARNPGQFRFPPLVKTKDLMDRLPDGQAVLAMFATANQIHGFLLTNQNYRAWEFDSPSTLRRGAAELLREMGNYDANRELSLSAVRSQKWRQNARSVLDQFVKSARIDLTKGIDELVIVPDGFLWQLPFEALVAGDGKEEGKPLLERMRIRYVPTTGLAIPERAFSPPAARTAVVVGKLFPRDVGSVAEAAFAGLKRAVPDAIALKAPLPAPSPVLATLLNTLIVLNDINPRDPYGWSPIGLDDPESAGALRQWFALPWGGARRIILPGFHTAAESGLKYRRKSAREGDLFLSVCGLMSCGARTILLSRWRTGGPASFDLVREFAQELPHTRAPDAWQRSVQLGMLQSVDSQREPRIKRTDTDDPPPADNPFFWAGYLLVDTGASPRDEDGLKDGSKPEEKPKPVFQFK